MSFVGGVELAVMAVMAVLLVVILAEVVERGGRSLADSKILTIESPIVASSRRVSSPLSTLGS